MYIHVHFTLMDTFSTQLYNRKHFSAHKYFKVHTTETTFFTVAYLVDLHIHVQMKDVNAIT